ncbi:MAG TPA: GAF domain-containing protein [Usitatibacter sp.]|nr:GAF domain-containing protein [Usitatibacter sp.]
MSALTLDMIRICCEGAVPATIATCSAEGVPNVATLSQVEYVDPSHLALSFQFFNTTRKNVLANPVACIIVIDPETVARYRLRIRYRRTETTGPLFERMKAKLAGIASHSGMSGVFRLQGSDVYEVESIERLPGEALPPPPPRRNLLSAVRACTQRIAAATDLSALFDTALEALRASFGIEHASILMHDARGSRLYTVASMGYADSGVGSEIPLGHGVIGVAARERTPIRIGHATSEYGYGRAMRESALAGGLVLETQIPLPGLAQSRSQVAVPIEAFGQLAGVLFADSERDLDFGYDEEDALVAVAGQLGTAMHVLQQAAENAEPATETQPREAESAGPPLLVRHFEENDSIFLGEDYLIKGVAGAIFWALASDFARDGRTRFTNRELRLDPRIRLPDLSDNLEARLILLQKRLEERGSAVRIEKTGRGQFRLAVSRPLQLSSVAGSR